MDKLDTLVWKTYDSGRNRTKWAQWNLIFDLGRFRVQAASGSNPDTPTMKNSRFCSVKVAKTAVFIEQGSELTQINPAPVWVKTVPKTLFAPDLTQTGRFS